MNWITEFFPILWFSKKRKHEQLEEIKISRKEHNDLINDLKERNTRRKRNYNNTITEKNKTITEPVSYTHLTLPTICSV